MRQRRKRRSHALRTLILILLAIALLIVVLNWLVMPMVVGRGRETTVPDLVGIDRFAAEESIIKAGLVLGDVRSVSNATVPPDRVVTQHPEPRQRVKLGRKVHIDVSIGGSRMKVPHVEGLTLARATTLLSASGISVAGVESLRSLTLPAGQVVSTRPPAGFEVDEGERITIQISSRVGNFPMPGLVGMNVGAASGILASQGLILGNVKQAPSDEPAGNVLIQYPEEGMTVRDLDTVSLIVAIPPGRR
ncbi:PASTA domain-containing protein [candidate division WOR-3 bacterium]|uniref:PASTA domain-containing protein n=1 Tax=candidate division WOR-3 bacterium TaxID=2052148 RepID=A0A938BSK4_UNCW3|nr:PASTA domain-containing protein [candidate division WOR-3 bacterium]